MPKNGTKKRSPKRNPRTAPGGSLADRVMVRDGLDVAILVADDRSDCVRLDHQVLRESLNFLFRLQSGCGVRVSDRDEICHVFDPPKTMSILSAGRLEATGCSSQSVLQL